MKPILIMITILFMLTILFARCVSAQEAPQTERPMVNGKQKLMELHIRNDGYCTIYRIEIDNVMYIVNTCGGIVVELKELLGRN